MDARALERPEMSQEQRVRIPREDSILARVPGFQIDIGRRCGRQDVIAIRSTDARSVADKRDPARRIEIRDVMRCMARRVRDVQIAAASDDVLPTCERADAAGGYRDEVSPQPVHIGAVKTTRACEQLRRIDHVPRATLVDEDLDCRVLADERPRHTRMIEMAVFQQKLAAVSDTTTLQPQRVLRVVVLAGGPASDQPPGATTM